MSNLTLSVDDDLIKRARVRAIQQGTSLSAKVREFLLHYVNEPDEPLQRQRELAADRLMKAIDQATVAARRAQGHHAPKSPTAAKAGKPASGRRRTLRDELYEDDFRARARAGDPPAAGR